MIYWAPLLHFYQPPTQLTSVLDRICEECYRPLIRVFREAPGARATFNISGSLTELLVEHEASDIIGGFRHLGQTGTIEFTGSAMYHPILPLIPASDQRRQINLNQRVNRRVYGQGFQPLGFFPPEMAFGPNIVPAIVESGHRWVIVSGVAVPGEWPLDVISRIDADGQDLAVFFRDDILSNQISFRQISPEGFFASLRALQGGRRDIYVVTAMDAETFGHHHHGWEEEFLAEAFRLASDVRDDGQEPSDDVIRVVKMSQLLLLFPEGPQIVPKESSWSTSGDDLVIGNVYPLWQAPGNRVHNLQWEIARLASEMVQRAEAVADNDVSRHFAKNARSQMDRALHSCQFWWASGRPMWEVNMIHRGLFEQQEAMLNATRAIRSSSAPHQYRRDALYQFIAARSLADRILEVLVE